MRQEGNSESLIQEVLARSKHTTQDVSQLYNALRRTPYPYEHHDRNATLTGFVVPAVPQPDGGNGSMYASSGADAASVFARDGLFLHGEQHFTYHRPVSVGDVLDARHVRVALTLTDEQIQLLCERATK